MSLIGFGVALESRAYEHSRMMEKVLSAISATGIDFNFAQGSVFVEWNGRVEEQVAVVNGVHTPVSKNVSDVFAQLLADHERMVKLLHEDGFFFGQAIRVVGIDSGEVVAEQLIVFPIEMNCAFFVVNHAEEFSSLHVPLGVAVEDLCFQFELNDGDSFVHECRQAFGFFVNTLGSATQAGLKFFAWVVAIGFHCECGKWNEVDAVSVFESCEIGVAQR